MTIPPLDLVSGTRVGTPSIPQQQQQQPAPPSIPALDVVSGTRGEQPPPPEQSVYSKAFFTLARLGGPFVGAPMDLRLGNTQQTDQAALQAGRDILNLGADLSSAAHGVVTPNLALAGQKLKETAEAISSKVASTFDNVHSAGDVYTQLFGIGYSLTLQPLATAAAAVQGRDPSTPDYRQLKPEEQVDAIKSTLAIAAAAGVGEVAAPLVRPAGFLGRAARAGFVGGASGAAFGAVAKAGTPDELSSALSSSLVFGGTGAILGAAFGPRLAKPLPSEVVRNIALLKQAQANVETSMAAAAANQKALQESQSIPEAIVSGTLALDPTGVHVVQGIDSRAAMMFAKDTKIDYHIRDNGDGSVDVLFPGTSNVDVATWKKSGLLPDQQVSVGGSIGQVSKINDDGTVIVRDTQGKELIYPPEMVRSIPGQSFLSADGQHPDGQFQSERVPMIGYRAVKTGVSPTAPGFQDAVYIGRSLSHAAKFLAKGNMAMYQLEMNFDNPLELKNPDYVDLASADSKTVAAARAAGHDAIIVDDNEIIALDPSKLKSRFSTSGRAPASLYGTYVEQILPRVQQGEKFETVAAEFPKDQQGNLEDINNMVQSVLRDPPKGPVPMSGKAFYNPASSGDTGPRITLRTKVDAARQAYAGSLHEYTYKLDNPLVINENRAVTPAELDAAEAKGHDAVITGKGDDRVITILNKDEMAQLKSTKVLNALNKPLRVYHGTTSVFDQFDPSKSEDGVFGHGVYWSGKPETANDYAGSGIRGKAQIAVLQAEIDALSKGREQVPVLSRNDYDKRIQELQDQIGVIRNQAPNVHVAYLDMRNPISDDNLPEAPELSKIATAIEKLTGERAPANKFLTGIDALHQAQQRIGVSDIQGTIDNALHQYGHDNVRVNDVLKEAGYDGVIGGIGNLKQYVVFDNEQIVPFPKQKTQLSRIVLDRSLSNEDIKFYRDNVLPRLKNGEHIANIMANLGEQQKAIAFLHDRMGATEDPIAMTNFASANGYRIRATDTGYDILDSDSGKRMATLRSGQEVVDWINKSGQTRGGELSGGAGQPPIDGQMSTSGQNENFAAKYAVRPLGRLERFFAGFQQAALHFTNKSAFLTAFDKLHYTQLLNKAYQPVQEGWMKFLAESQVAQRRLKGIEQDLGRSSMNRRSLVGQYIETMSPEEIMNNALSRPMTSEEIEAAKFLAAKNGGNPVDIQNVFNYRQQSKGLIDAYQKELANIDKLGKNNPGLEAARQQKVDEYKQKLKDLVDELSPEDMQAVQMLDGFAKRSPGDVSIYAVTKLGRAWQNPENALTRADFAEKYKLTMPEMRAATQLDAMWKDLAQTFGIDEARQLRGYMNHYAVTRDFPVELSPRFMRGKVAAQGFISDMIRSGALDSYVDDPIHAMAMYINRGYRVSSGFTKAIADARNAAVEELEKVPGGSRNGVARVLSEYFNEAQGVPGYDIAVMQDGFDHMMDALGIKTPRNLRRDVINGWLSWTNSAYLGFKPELALRDMATWNKMYYSRFGSVRVLNALRYMWEKNPETGLTQADELMLSGKNPGLSPVGILSAEEIAAQENGMTVSNTATRVANKVGEMGLTLSGQKNIYSRIHAGAYLEASRLASDNIIKLYRNEITKAQAYDNIDLDSYDGPVAQHFDDLVTNGKFQEAADYIGRVTARETAFIHGFGDHPLGWGTNVGRLLGQFGTWGTQARDFMFRLSSRGTPLKRTARLTRFVAAEAATKAAGSALGLNLHSWMILPGLQWVGGPIIQDAVNSVALTGGMGDQKQKEAIGELLSQFSVNGFRNAFVPGSYAFHDYVDAINLGDQGFGPVPMLGRGLGFTIDKGSRSWLDDWMGYNPQIQQQPSVADFTSRRLGLQP